MDRREARRTPCCSQASRSTTAETGQRVFVQHQSVSTLASLTWRARRSRLSGLWTWRGLALSRVVASPLEAILRRYESPDHRCRGKIFCDIFVLAFGSVVARGLVDFQTCDAEQAFLPGVEHARP